MEASHGSLDCLPLIAAELTTDSERDHHLAITGLPPHAALGPASYGVSGFGSQQVSFQQCLIGGVVGHQNSGADVNSVIIHLVFDVFLLERTFFTDFLLDRICLREAEQQQQQQADRGTHLHRGSGVCGASVESCCGETP